MLLAPGGLYFFLGGGASGAPANAITNPIALCARARALPLSPSPTRSLCNSWSVATHPSNINGLCALTKHQSSTWEDCGKIERSVLSLVPQARPYCLASSSVVTLGRWRFCTLTSRPVTTRSRSSSLYIYMSPMATPYFPSCLWASPGSLSRARYGTTAAIVSTNQRWKLLVS
jgi:hypothetical protein